MKRPRQDDPPPLPAHQPGHTLAVTMQTDSGFRYIRCKCGEHFSNLTMTTDEMEQAAYRHLIGDNEQ